MDTEKEEKVSRAGCFLRAYIVVCCVVGALVVGGFIGHGITAGIRHVTDEHYQRGYEQGASNRDKEITKGLVDFCRMKTGEKNDPPTSLIIATTSNPFVTKQYFDDYMWYTVTDAGESWYITCTK